MSGLGTVVNVAAILGGCAIGLLVKGGLPKHLEDTITSAVGLCVIFVGISGALKGMMTVTAGGLDTRDTLVMVLCMVIGSALGEWIDIEDRLEQLGIWCKSKIPAGKASGTFVEAFVSSSLLFCVGAMAIVGALENGLTGSYDTLKAKSVIDGISSIVFASSLGVGVAFSAGAIFLYQGAISLLAGLLSPLLGDAVIAEMTCVGSLLIVALSLNMLNVTKIKVMNLVPAIFLPILLCRFM